jgi:hypothetical protein
MYSHSNIHAYSMINARRACVFSTRRWLIPMTQHLINSPRPLSSERIRKLGDLLSCRGAASPSRGLRSLVLRIVRDELTRDRQNRNRTSKVTVENALCLHLTERKPTQIP